MLLRNNFSSGPSGTTLTVANSGAGDDDPWYLVSKTGANTVMAYDLAPDRPTAEFVGLFSTGVASGQSVVAWVPGGSFTQIWMRMYVYLAVLPNNFNSPTIFYCEDSAGPKLAIIAVNSSGSNEIIISNKDDTQTMMTTVGPTAQQWFRIEAHFTFSTTVGAIEMKWFDDPDSDTPTETLNASNWNLGAANAEHFYFGYIEADSNLEALRLSGLEINDSGYPGPLPFHQKAMPGYQPTPIAVHSDTF